jgi:HAE1 family hydrophobic/amphiphilic exporter-1
VFSGMIASTCLAVLFVPSFFAVLQRFDEWRKRRKRASAGDSIGHEKVQATGTAS